MKANPADRAVPYSLHEYSGVYRTAAASDSSLPMRLFRDSRLEIVSALAWSTEPGWMIPPRTRRESYLWIIIEGEGELYQTGSSGKTALRPGCAVLVPENTSHRVTHSGGSGFRVLIFRFHLRYLNTLEAFSLLGMGGELPSLPEQLIVQAESLCEAFARKVPGWEKLVSAGLLLMLYPAFLKVEKSIEMDGVSLNSSGMTRLLTALNHIQKHLKQPGLCVGSTASSAGVSEVYMRRLFREHLKKSPGEFILARRLDLAEEMLKQTDMPVEVVAESCGFDSASYFYRAFKNVKGCTPGYIRNTCR